MISIMVNGAPRECRAAMTVAQLLQDLGIGGDGTAVAVNDAVLPRSQHAQRLLAAGDRLEILHAVAGG